MSSALHNLDANGNVLVAQGTLLTGENQQFDRLFGGAMAQYAAVGADTLIKSGSGIIYGVLCTSAGTLVGLYDNTAASGTALMLPGAMTANQFISFGGVGVQFNTGLYADWTSGSFIILYV